MILFSSFLFEFIILFLLSRELTRTLSYCFYRITKSRKITVILLSILFFPGTVIHELAHAITAQVLGVHVGHIELVPKIDSDRVTLGSVQIAHSDPIRRFLIGVAPFFWGTGIILGVLFYASTQHVFHNYILDALICYVLFEIGNTMFASKKDMEGTIEVVGASCVVILFLYLLGVKITFLNPGIFLKQPFVVTIMTNGTRDLLVPLVLDICLILIFRPLKKKKNVIL